MRLNQYLAKSGIGSRRECDLFIQNGLIKINGKIIKDFSYKITSNDCIQYKNKYVEAENNNYYFILHKPKGYVCTLNDEYKRKIIYDLLPNNLRLFSVGRLDYNTSGIIILTNDGNFSHLLSHPKYVVIKKYYVLTDNKLHHRNILLIKKGIKIDNITMSASPKFLERTKRGCIWEISMSEGKNREIKKIFNYFNINVLKLHRFEFAGIRLGKLKEGKYRLINKKELNQIKNNISIK